MGAEIERLAAFAAETAWDDIPAAVKQHAKLTLLDTLGVILGGTGRPEVRALRASLANGTGAKDAGATAFGCDWSAASPPVAALLNGIAGRAIELCEGLRMASGQVAVQILPGLLAAAEARNLSGQAVLRAFILGYDVAARLSLAFTPWPLAHQNGQVCLIGAAAAGAALRGMDAAGVSLAMRAAATLVLTPSYTSVGAGATALNAAGGMSGFAGVLAPELAAAGFTAQADAIEIGLGNLTGRGFAPAGLVEDLGTVWHITRNYFRLYACCNPIHPALDALKAVLDQLQPKPEEIDRIDVATYRFASVMSNPDPENYFASKYSLPHIAAVMAVTGRADHAATGDEALREPAVVSLRKRVHIEEDAAMTAKVPALRPARVTVRLVDGRSGTCAVESHRGDFNDPFTEEEIRGKFRGLAGDVLTPEGVYLLEDAVARMEAIADAWDLAFVLRAHVRA
ncbi:MAG TPA: MmgE/PrpD family protein [Rhodopila sp.]|uniref:MmgE/PrpD family protein n=1 Tax=Rhodopila sp. TaxID=2480087 RepID=UPI002BC61413|nr:MmgE/PrpD family protein [Rhodopila sp.]HVY14679.1 MmgE/PrpD family protein [Rhodopila sp.]